MATKGPSEAFVSVCDRELGIDDFYDVYDKIESLSARWKPIAISLHMKLDTISKIRANANGDTTACLQEVLECWLKKDYDYERHGVPCWRRVCVAVKKGGDSALADEIAQEHPVTEGTTPHTRTTRARGAGSTASIPTPSIYVPQAITNFELHRELSEIQDQFAEAVQKTIKYYSKEWLPDLIDYITTHITTLLSPHENTPDKTQAVRKEFKNITTIEELFGLLQDKYTSWFKHEPITKLIYENDTNPYSDYEDENEFNKEFDEYGFPNPDYVEKAPSSWYRYKERLHKYFEKCVTVADSALYGITDAPPGKPVIIAKVDRGDYNQNDLYFLRKAIPRGLDKPDLKLYLCQVLPN
ncbi:PREDICTED: uncharacterized protein LOC109590696 [Amphimedon queenslandica]|uniref:Death domain-containing protein n=1 Tax=Amphimedon queenslandica TaxID=400682 RepID=A0A1X7SZ89_AMPQE|nr:PREDICTED: uncharacterized protein LOC109590696 [Amphimedon queenslandica]|eukprot:XP_019862141.1 PREDICTED: uncharacterized protein LOC109590696 [Amphimedon queenslandica]